MPDLRERILRSSFELFPLGIRFASGKLANNKLDLEHIQRDKALRAMIVRRLGQRVLEHSPDAIVAVPDGANWIAKDIADQYDELTLIRLKRNQQNRDVISFQTAADRVLCGLSERAVLLEDAINEFTSTQRVAAIPEIGKIIVAEEAIWDRGDPTERIEPEFPYRALITEPIPLQLPAESPLRQYARGNHL